MTQPLKFDDTVVEKEGGEMALRLAFDRRLSTNSPRSRRIAHIREFGPIVILILPR
jgi:hypothetical protein